MIPAIASLESDCGKLCPKSKEKESCPTCREKDVQLLLANSKICHLEERIECLKRQHDLDCEDIQRLKQQRVSDRIAFEADVKRLRERHERLVARLTSQGSPIISAELSSLQEQQGSEEARGDEVHSESLASVEQFLDDCLDDVQKEVKLNASPYRPNAKVANESCFPSSCNQKSAGSCVEGSPEPESVSPEEDYASSRDSRSSSTERQSMHLQDDHVISLQRSKEKELMQPNQTELMQLEVDDDHITPLLAAVEQETVEKVEASQGIRVIEVEDLRVEQARTVSFSGVPNSNPMFKSCGF